MRLKRNNTVSITLLIFFLQFSSAAFSQLGITLDIPKPKEFENRVLRSEKSDQKKFTKPKRFIQNTITHYNYFFNANQKLNEVLERAKLSFKDDYSELLPFYNYSLDVTAADSIQLDSITYKSQSGIVLHDLRNDWIDNLYLLWGASYYLRKQFDSAYLMFQFINYAFAPKEKDGYYRNIGSNMDGNNAFSIATKEKNTLLKRMFSEPPSRNDAFIWQIRNFLAQDHFAEAASLIITLRNDPQFPTRLHNDLEEVQAYYFYKQKQWDSTAAHLEKALSNATNKQERARWEYLLAQLYEMTGNYDAASSYYAKAINHTTDPIMDIYARLFSVRVNKDDGEDYIGKNIATLVKMAKRDKYQDYRDIIYYMAAQMELERNNIDGALALLEKSTKYPSNDPAQRNKAFLQLAELSFGKRLYRNAYNFYDSLKLDDPTLKNPEAISERKAILGRLADNLEIIERQDSLQRLAGMDESERIDFVKKLARHLRKMRGLKDDGNSRTSPLAQPTVPSLFQSSDTRGEWYFYNKNSRQKGLADFKSRWGARPNEDNWRRMSSLSQNVRINKTDPLTGGPGTADPTTTQDEGDDISFETLYEKIPLTPEMMDISNDSIQHAMFNLGRTYVQELEDCTLGTETFEDLRIRFPNHPKMDEVLFNLYFCYNKNGENEKADALKKLLADNFEESNYTTIVLTGKNPMAKTGNVDATNEYERIYDLFIEGKFAEAIQAKASADSMYGRNHWTPQLLYIEAVYYIKQRDDSTAKRILNDIKSSFTGTAIEEKATTMLDVLSRRAQIEEELRNLVIERPEEDTTTRYRPTNTQQPVAGRPVQQTQDSTIAQQKPPVIANPATDTTATNPVVNQPQTADFAFTPDVPHYVLLLLNKVDPIFVNEARNAFSRHNSTTFYTKRMTAELVDIDAENKLLIISPFRNAQEATDYVDQTRPITSSQIVPWLKGGKYTFYIITENNLNILKEGKDVEAYKSFLEKHMPGKFN